MTINTMIATPRRLSTTPSAIATESEGGDSGGGMTTTSQTGASREGRSDGQELSTVNPAPLTTILGLVFFQLSIAVTGPGAFKHEEYITSAINTTDLSWFSSHTNNELNIVKLHSHPLDKTSDTVWFNTDNLTLLSSSYKTLGRCLNYIYTTYMNAYVFLCSQVYTYSP